MYRVERGADQDASDDDGDAGEAERDGQPAPPVDPLAEQDQPADRPEGEQRS